MAGEQTLHSSRSDASEEEAQRSGRDMSSSTLVGLVYSNTQILSPDGITKSLELSESEMLADSSQGNFFLKLSSFFFFV